MYHRTPAAIAAAVAEIEAMISAGGIAIAGPDIDAALMPIAATAPLAPALLTAGHPVFCNPAAAIARGRHGEIVTFRVGAVDAPAADLAALYVDAGGLRKPYKERAGKRYSSHLAVSIYGWHSPSGLMVAQEREGTWDDKYGFGDMTKTYVLVDAAGNRAVVPHGKVRGAVRRAPHDAAAPIVGAIADAFSIAPATAVRRLEEGTVRLADLVARAAVL